MALTRKQMRAFLNAIEGGASLENAADLAGARLSSFYARTDPETTTYDARFAAEFSTVQAARARTLTWRQAEDGEWRAIDKVGNTYVPEMQPQAQRLEITGGTQELVVKHDPSAIMAMLEEVGLVRRFAPAAPDRAEPPALLPARTD